MMRPMFNNHLSKQNPYKPLYDNGVRTGLVVRESDSRSGDPGSILSRVGVLFP